MSRYLLPCSCGQTISVGTIQAGQEVFCDCGQSQVAPTLREIRQLPEEEVTVTQHRLVRVSWSGTRTTTFAIGLIVAAITAGAVGMVRVKIAGIKSYLPTKKEMKAYDDALNSQMIDKLTAEEAYEHFFNWKQMGLGEQGSRAFEVEHAKVDKLSLISWSFVVLGAIGLLVTLIAMLWPRGTVETT